MCKLLLIILSTCIARSVSASRFIPMIGEQLHGKIAQVLRIDSSAAAPGSRIIYCGNWFDEVGHSTNILDERGNQVLCKYYNNNGNLIREISNEYDNNNNRIKTIVKDSIGNTEATRDYKYDNNGYPVALITYNSNYEVISVSALTIQYRNDKRMFYYDENGKPVKTVLYYEDNSTGCVFVADTATVQSSIVNLNKTDTIKYTKDSMMVTISYEGGNIHTELYVNNNVVEYINYNSNGDTVEMENTTYDINNNILQHTAMYYGTVIQGQKDEYIYFAGTKLIGYRIYRWQNGWTLLQDEIYDSNQRTLKQIIYAKNIRYTHRITYFDAYYNPLHHIRYNKDGSIMDETFYRYEDYDAQGNWKRRISWTWNGADMSMDKPYSTYLDIRYQQ